MQVVERIADLRKILADVRIEGREIGFVPTMGYLHAGHLALISTAKQANQYVVVSIFVNPLQFGPNEDFASYPRDMARDCDLAEGAGADIIFAPPVEEMYPRQSLTGVEVAQLGEWLCGRSRPGHFRGVTTVVTKLFNIVQPDRAYFGQKDAQQLAIIQQMVFDLNIPVEVVPVPIVREQDGLAMSSRNVYLSPEQRRNAVGLHRALQSAKDAFRSGERKGTNIRTKVLQVLAEIPGAEVDYVEVCDPYTLQPAEDLGDRALLALAVRFGNTRLIDNITMAEA
ncbi:MAG TPA: pantoate--beta-alanine ligase [Verrucomicrobiae bacterium]|nr:pantoate--beta-alanine ligase [Verrucomicrobiae bacterium]